MLNYDFRNLLSAFEFECFTRDLLNVHEGLNLGNFAEGRDGGIDLRYTNDKGKTVVVQAKRYKDYAELKAVLKKEVDKVKKLKPNRYIITTSVDLTANNKSEIIDTFKPYIKNENDVIAKQDLNKLLSLHPEIERKYYKLWLASTSVLEEILHKDIVNWTHFEEEEIKETVKTYVMNDSFNEALQKLLINRYVVISGEPGIGKTTLARVLVLHLLSDKFKDQPESSNFDQFCYTNGNINDFVSLLKEGKRQVFFYDDFLGQIALEEGEKNFDRRLITFIHYCKKSQDKLLILTTREYIFQQGLIRYPNLTTRDNIEFSKCVVDMGKYTRFVRAQILYNHLVANNIPQEYINSILFDKNYLKIIDHPHFSPRIIETFLKNGIHNSCEPNIYFDKVKDFFDKPDSVWLDAFQKLSIIAQEALLVFTTMKPTIVYEDWRAAFNHFYNEVHKETGYLSEHKWNEIVKVLQNNFIKIGKSSEGIYVAFHNPGIKDVLTRYINSDNSLKIVLYDHAYFIDQILGVLQVERNDSLQISASKDLIDSFINNFDRCWNDYRSCNTILKPSINEKYCYIRKPHSKVGVLNVLLSNYKNILDIYPDFIELKINEDLMTNDSNGSLAEQLELLDNLDLSKVSLDLDYLFENYKWRLGDSGDFLLFASSIERLFPNNFDYLNSEEFCKRTEEQLHHEYEQAKDSELDELNSIANELSDYITLLGSRDIIETISEANEKYNDEVDAMAEAYLDDYRFFVHVDENEDDRKIDNLFDTIKE
jgi:hypothetical protein